MAIPFEYSRILNQCWTGRSGLTYPASTPVSATNYTFRALPDSSALAGVNPVPLHLSRPGHTRNIEIKEQTMTHAEIEALAKAFVVDTAKGDVDSRVQKVVLRFAGDLFKAIVDLDLSPT